MSIAALLSHFGINAARFVTTTGQIIFDGVTKTGTGYSHPVHGSVTPVVKHTFHGGQENPDDLQDSPAVWWDDENQIQRHIKAMEKAFPEFVYAPPQDGSGPYWVGIIDTGRGKFKVGIYLRRDRGLPRIVVLNRRLGMPAGRWWQPSPHLYINGNLASRTPTNGSRPSTLQPPQPHGPRLAGCLHRVAYESPMARGRGWGRCVLATSNPRSPNLHKTKA